ncbi:hypothetical protein AGMMS50276_27470 [Synergistales bacterium]|nr:hypothetical protein AGMMS50276_27470 [Synergistales bacterium]
MSKQKGTKKTGGRAKGTPNKVTSEVKTWLSELIDSNRKQIERDLKALEPKDRLNILEKFMQYTVPKMQSVEAKVKSDFSFMDLLMSTGTIDDDNEDDEALMRHS